MKTYSVVFIFNEDLDKVLLIKKHRTTFAGRYNGVGGKMENSDLCARECAMREVAEETGLSDIDTLTWIGGVTLPHDCDEKNPEAIVMLHFYTGITKTPDAVKQLTDEELCWWSVNEVLRSTALDERFAGDGDLQYFVNRSLLTLRSVMEVSDGDI